MNNEINWQGLVEAVIAFLVAATALMTWVQHQKVIALAELATETATKHDALVLKLNGYALIKIPDTQTVLVNRALAPVQDGFADPNPASPPHP